MSRQPPRPDSGLYKDWKEWANALLRYLQLVGEESLLEAGTQVKTYVSTDVPSAEQAGQLIYQTDTLKVSASFNDVWNDFAFLSTANVWTAVQEISGSSSLFTALRAVSTNDDANPGPYVILDRQSANAATSDNLGVILFRGKDANGDILDYGNIAGIILDATNGAEKGYLQFTVIINGAAVNQFSVGNGVRIGNPTGGFQGQNTLNTSGNIFRDGLKVIGTRITGWAADTGTDKRTANATYSGTAEAAYTQATIQTLMDTVRDLSQTIKALKDDLHSTAGHGLIGT